ERLVRVAARWGVTKLRITGGEPLVRADLPQLIARLARVPGIVDLALSTNGMLLAEQASALAAAGLKRVNISLDAMNAAVFERVSRRKGFERVLEGIAAAAQAGFDPIKLNTVVVRGINEDQIVPLARYAREHRFHLRFIEFMPLDADRNWAKPQVLAGEQIRAEIERALEPLYPVSGADPHQPAVDYQFLDGTTTIGFINTVTQPFCGDCNRLRVTAEGQLRNCLFATDEWDARRAMRAGGSDDELAELLRACVGAKRAGHGIDSHDFLRPRRAMFQIGG
ncbi:MAG TPA: GTP 3',8-cyclase MoaA, partial [Pirellulales bacterium]|nr:GTP 3',8-cyclase MoaA [Pirellulales bacterium]